jgi:predicted ArsR family transcriptional regulator
MDVPLVEQVKAQAQVLVPLVKTLQAELGEQQANDLVRKALGGWAYKMGQQISTMGTGSPAEKMAAALPLFSAGNALDIEVLKQTPDAFEFNVTGCRYAQFYKELGMPELGFLFVCAQDFPLTEGFSPDLELVRTQTVMQGASHCDFRFRTKNKK